MLTMFRLLLVPHKPPLFSMFLLSFSRPTSRSTFKSVAIQDANINWTLHRLVLNKFCQKNKIACANRKPKNKFLNQNAECE